MGKYSLHFAADTCTYPDADADADAMQVFSAPDRDQKPGSVVQMADNAIHWINLYPLDSAVGFPNHPLDSDLSGFERLPWPVNSAIQLLPNNWGQRSVWDRSHVNSPVSSSL